jgi:hypothetical protein
MELISILYIHNLENEKESVIFLNNLFEFLLEELGMHGLLLDMAHYQNYNGYTIILDVGLELHWHRTDTVIILLTNFYRGDHLNYLVLV